MILDPYQGFYGGQPPGAGDRVLSFDAKPSIQARERVRATLPAAPGRVMRVEHEYVRHGALALLAGLDVRTGAVFASTPKTTGIAAFMDLVGEVMARPEYKNAPGCSSWWTTGRTTAARPRWSGCARRTRMRS